MEAVSGAGKSSLCHYILGYRNDFSGGLFFDDKDVRSLSMAGWDQVRRTGISHLFQELRIFPELTAWENVVLKNNLTGWLDDDAIKGYFWRLGLAGKMEAPCGRMSFGQQQRVAAIRALAQPFDFLLVDEPVSHLDEANAQAMGELFKEECERRGAGLIVTSIGKHFNIEYDQRLRL